MKKPRNKRSKQTRKPRLRRANGGKQFSPITQTKALWNFLSTVALLYFLVFQLPDAVKGLIPVLNIFGYVTLQTLVVAVIWFVTVWIFGPLLSRRYGEARVVFGSVVIVGLIGMVLGAIEGINSIR